MTPSRLISWAEKTDPKTGRLVEEIMKRGPHPEQGYRACLELMSPGRRSGAERLEAASARALHLQSYSYRTVKNILSSAQDRLPFGDTETPPTPHHDNIRGAAYYADPEGDALMLMEQTLEKMNQMKLSAMVEALQQQRRSNQYTDLGFEERLGLLVDEEWTAREHRKLTRRLRAAKLPLRDGIAGKTSTSNIVAVWTVPKSLALGSCGWIQDRHNLLITGPTGIGKSFSGFGFRRTRLPAGF